jgi:hypothetical protein
MAASTVAARNRGKDITFSVPVWKEGASYVAYSPELDISSCAKLCPCSSKKRRGWERSKKSLPSLGLSVEEKRIDGVRSLREKMRLALPAA